MSPERAEPTPSPEPPRPGSGRERLLLAAGAALAFGALITVLLLTSGGSESTGSATAAPSECVDAWNESRDAVSFARHNAIFHNYERAQVGYLSLDPEPTVSADSDAGDCVVVFARGTLDPEPVAAGQIHRDGVWLPLREIVDVNTLARLQSEAFDRANAGPTLEGTIEPR